MYFISDNWDINIHSRYKFIRLNEKFNSKFFDGDNPRKLQLKYYNKKYSNIHLKFVDYL